MTTMAGSRLVVRRTDLASVDVVPDPDAPSSRALADGEVRLAIEQFGLTSNNITYAAFGESMQYWQFFPTAGPEWGCVPVWGFATVLESRAAAIGVGLRLFGCLPMGTHLVVSPHNIGMSGFDDGASHRQPTAAVYRQLTFCAGDPDYNALQEGQQALLRPLFTTAFLIDHFLADSAYFGAEQLLLSSASSKTAYATAFCLCQRTDAPKVIGLTSERNVLFARSLGCYAEVLTYADCSTVDAARPTVYVDFAGDAALRRAVHQQFAGTLMYSCSVGGTHVGALGRAGDLPGPRPVLFFAPAQAAKRIAQPPEGWGSAGFRQRHGEAWTAFMRTVNDSETPWLRVRSASGPAAVAGAYHHLLQGTGDPRDGLILSF